MIKYYQPTTAVLDNISRGIALSKKYQRESHAAKQRTEQVELAKSFKEDGFDIKAVSTIYHSLLKLEKSLDFNKRLWDNGHTEEVIKYYALGGNSGLAWAKMVLKAEGILNSNKQEITQDQINEVSKDAVGSLYVVKSLNEELMQVTYVAMKIGTDLHGDYSDAVTVRKAKESFNKSLMKANLFHQEMTDSFSIIESYLAPTTMILNSNIVEEGEWLVTLQVHNEEIWKMIKSDDITGVSIGAMASVEKVIE
jgi:hypothetical protein